MDKPLEGRVALVAGATRGCGRAIAVQLGLAGATVYATGRTTRMKQSEMSRPETIEETAELVDRAGGRGIAVQVDHLEPDQVRELAVAENVPLIDLTAATTELYERLGPEGSKALFTHFPPGAHPLYPEGVADDTHFCFRGADEVAAIVAEGLKEIA